MGHLGGGRPFRGQNTLSLPVTVPASDCRCRRTLEANACSELLPRFPDKKSTASWT